MKTIAMVLFGAMATACYADAQPPVQSASASAQLPSYATFSFGLTATSPSGYEASPASLQDDQHLRDIVAAALRRKGYVEDNDRPSFLVRLGAGTKRVVSHPTEEADPLGVVRDDVLSLEGITVAIYDAATKTEMWQGSASAIVDPRRDSDSGRLQHEVQDALATFPIRSLSPSAPAAQPVAASGNAAIGQSDSSGSSATPVAAVHAMR